MMLLDRGAPGDREKAQTLLREPLETYTRIGMPRHIEMTQTLFARAPRSHLTTASRARRTPRHRDLERNEGSTNRLRDLLGEGGEIEVVAPDSDFAGIATAAGLRRSRPRRVVSIPRFLRSSEPDTGGVGISYFVTERSAVAKLLQPEQPEPLTAAPAYAPHLFSCESSTGG
jgi:hypothetical protein